MFYIFGSDRCSAHLVHNVFSTSQIVQLAIKFGKIKPKALIQSGTDALSNVGRVDLLLSNGLDTISPKLQPNRHIKKLTPL
jgi:hypothetical protein